MTQRFNPLVPLLLPAQLFEAVAEPKQALVAPELPLTVRENLSGLGQLAALEVILHASSQ